MIGAMWCSQWLSVELVAGEPLAVGIDHAARGVQQAFPRRIVAGPAQQGTHGIFCLRAGDVVADLVGHGDSGKR